MDMDKKKYFEKMIKTLEEEDPVVFQLIIDEVERRNNSLNLIASENVSSPAVYAALGNSLNDKTVEGYPGRRYHTGAQVADEIENLAIERVKELTGATHANVQPHSCSQANHAVIFSVAENGDPILSMSMSHGGHLTHGGPPSLTYRVFNIHTYGVNKKTYLINYDEVRRIAHECRPKLIICGASSYPRQIDFKQFREITDEVGAYLFADVSHIFGLIVAHQHPDPMPYAHFMTAGLYKAGGPHGGVILLGKDCPEKFHSLIDRHIFPFLQGTPAVNQIAAKAVLFKEAATEKYRESQKLVVADARALAEAFLEKDYEVCTGGTDNHMLLMDITNKGHTGRTAQGSLERCHINVNMNLIPFDKLKPRITSGLRIGTPIIGRMGIQPNKMPYIAELIDEILSNSKAISKRRFQIDQTFQEQKIKEVKDFVRQYR